MTASQDPLGIVGTVIDQKYRVEAVIGEGGFSVVYRAEHIIWKQPVALKCFNVLAGVAPQLRQDLLNGFIQEGKLMTSLSTRTAAIVQARDVGTLKMEGGQELPYMVLEWLEGKPLDRVLHFERSQSTPARSIYDVLALLEPVASALEVAHAQGIAHRDIKPANLFVLGDARAAGVFVKILDFGIAKVMAEHAQLQTSLAQTGQNITAFTPNYGAPEQYSRSHGATGPWTDVFALALIMVELLRGGIPALQGEDYLQLAVASRDPNTRPTPRTFGLYLPDEVERVFGKALSVEPRNRYKTAGEFWMDLHAAVFPDSPLWAPMTVGGGPTGSTLGAQRGSLPGVGSGNTGITGPQGTQIPGSPAHSTGPRYATPPGISPPSTSSPSSMSAPMTGQAPFSQVAPKRSNGLFIGLAGLALLGGIGTAVALMRSKPPELAQPSAQPSVTSSAAAAPLEPETCPAGMATVPGGKFFMGSDDQAFPLWSPAHKVTLSTYCIDLTEVTAEAYKACADKGGCKRAEMKPAFPKSNSTTPDQHEKNLEAYAELCNFAAEGEIKPGREKHPVNCVSWERAAEFCKENGKRLPTEAEWEFAARGSDGRKFPWGDKIGADAKHMNACGKECAAWEQQKGIVPSSQTMYEEDDGYPGTAPVGSFPQGRARLDLDDMVGNVWEWTSDYYATYSSEEQTDPQGAKAGDKRAIRGGGFNGGYSAWVNPAFRYHQEPTASVHGIGFRCAKSLSVPAESAPGKAP